jgi:streptogramin lyase
MLAVSDNAEVFVAEIGAHRLQRFILSADCVATAEACDYTATLGWPALGAPGLDPLSIAVDGDRVYVGHQGQPASIWVLDRESGQLLTVLGEGAFERPHGLFVADDGTLWIADDRGNQVVHLSADGRVLGTIGKP